MAHSKRDFEALLKRLSAPERPIALRDSSVLAPGAVVDSLRIERLLGRGGMAEVYLAEHLPSGMNVALKCLLSGLELDEAARARFSAEVATLRGLRHPNIVDFFASGALPNGCPYLCMEYLKGPTLHSLLEQTGRLPESEVLSLGIALCDALDAAHAHGVIHRDLKPANVFCAQLGHGKLFKVADFGLAKAHAAPEARITTTGVVLGTPYFMAPEQTRGERALSPRSDLYALGVVLYRCVSGRLPFEGRSFAELALQICTQEPEPPAHASPELASLIAKAMRKDPEARFASAPALRFALSELDRAQRPCMH